MHHHERRPPGILPGLEPLADFLLEMNERILAREAAERKQPKADARPTYQKLMTTEQAADYIGYTPGTLRTWRAKGRGPKYIKADPDSPQSHVRYRVAALEEWATQHEQKAGG